LRHETGFISTLSSYIPSAPNNLADDLFYNNLFLFAEGPISQSNTGPYVQSATPGSLDPKAE